MGEPLKRFYLGTHEEWWLNKPGFPLFVSHRRLAPRRKTPVAKRDWACDSGAFTELYLYGEFRTTPHEYVDALRGYVADIGRMDWAAPQDWMCEPFMVAKTGLSVAEHQARTVENFCLLRQLAPEMPIMPVIQGWSLDDYYRCIDRYRWAGVDLYDYSVVGVGSVCRRQGTAEIADIFATLNWFGLKLHGFGVKTLGLTRYGRYLTSADSMAWSLNARKRDPLPSCTHRSCANCYHWARSWRRELVQLLGEEWEG